MTEKLISAQDLASVEQSAAVLSIVLPVCNEQDTLPELARRLNAVCDQIAMRAEVIFVDDGSRDQSLSVIRGLCANHERFCYIGLSRNFGHQAAISAGLDAATGDAVVVMDSDLQHPPELIPDLIAKWQEGYEIVYAVRSDRAGERWVKRKFSVLFYRLLQRLTRTDMAANAGDFRLIDRSALQAFRQLPERNRYLRGMFHWIGFRQTGVPYGYYERFGGVPKYTFRRMLHLAADGITSFTNAPLHLSLHLGFFMAALSFLVGVFAIISKIAGLHLLPGWVSIMVGLSFIGGVQLLVMGVVGLYMGRMYDEVKRRPVYIVKDCHGVDVHSTTGVELATSATR